MLVNDCRGPGYRDRPAADMDGIARALVGLATLIAEHPDIRELDVNPLLADDTGVIALDARVRIAARSDAPRVPMSIRPYPSLRPTPCWQMHVRCDCGRSDRRTRRFMMSSCGVSPPGDMRLRFFTAQKGLSKGFVARLTQIDYARQMAFVALDAASKQLLGVARIIADTDYERAEYAILVRSELQGQGLGWQLMQHLIGYCKADEIHGSVLSDKLCWRCAGSWVSTLWTLVTNQA